MTTRDQFMTKLKRGLRGLDPAASAVIIGDYESYFAEGVHAGRDEAELAASLGDPRRLTAELRLSANLESWRRRPTLAAALRTTAGVLGLAILDLLLIAPFALALLVTAAGMLGAAVAVIAGAASLLVGPFTDPAGGPFAAALHGLGVMSAGLAGVCVFVLILAGLIDLFGRMGRLHARILPSPPERSA